MSDPGQILPTKGDAHSPSPIIPAKELSVLISASRRMAEAEATLADAKTEAIAIRQNARREGWADGVTEGAVAAQSIIDAAEASARARALEMEDTLANLVADVVRRVIGDADREATTRSAVTTALSQLSAKGDAVLHVAPDILASVEAATSDNAQITAVRVDEGLAPGECMFSSGQLHVRIGLAAQLDAALAPFESP